MEKMIKHLLFTYGRVIANPLQGAEGQPDTIVVEGLARLGDVVDISRDYDLQLGERTGAFYTDEERKAIENGTYNGLDAPSIAQARLQSQQQVVMPVEGEGVQADVDEMSAEELADYIVENNLNVPQTIDLAGEGDDVDRINKVLDAESLAMRQKDADPRKGVVDALEKRAAQQ